MDKFYTALGLMSGTSGDGVDASIIKSDGYTKYEVISDEYYEYNDEIYQKYLNLRDGINDMSDYERYRKELFLLEAKITSFHINIVNEIIKNSNIDIDFIGFHGQTIYHNPEGRFSRQLGNGNLLSNSTKKTVIFDFRANDLKHNGQGAPLTPIFHKLLAEQNKLIPPVTILNIGGIANITHIEKDFKISSMDIGPGNCLIDKWVRKNSNKLIDENGRLAKSGKIDKFIFDQFIENFYYSGIIKKKSLDTNDFDIAFAKGLSLEDGAKTITHITVEILSDKLKNNDIYICGGGRKNKYFIECLKNKTNGSIYLIDDLKIDGDYIESQAFAFLAIRSYLGLPISFPETTGCDKPITGGVIVKNF